MMAEPPTPDTPNAAASIDAIRGGSHRQLVDAQLSEERTNKNGLEQRALGVITTSGILATLVFGVAAFATQGRQLKLTLPDQLFLAFALGTFVLAALAALVAIAPRHYEEAGLARLQWRVDKEQWFLPDPAEGYRLDAQVEVDVLEASRKANGSKARWLFASVALDVMAIAFVATAVTLVIYGS